MYLQTQVYTLHVSKLASIASGNIAAIKDVQNKFPSGVYQRAKKKEAYNYLVGKGYSSTVAGNSSVQGKSNIYRQHRWGQSYISTGR